MKNKKVWIPILVVAVLLVAGLIFRNSLLGLLGLSSSASAQTPTTQATGDAATAPTTTAIRAANNANQVSASGNVAVSNEYAVVLQQSGIVQSVTVNVGDVVKKDTLLAQLETGDLERAVKQAELALASAQASYDKLTEKASAAEVASAQASLTSAQESLLEVQAGASATETAAAQATLASAWAKYNDLKAGPSNDELVQLAATMEKAFITLQQAQQAYDKIAYTDSAGTSGQAAELRTATIDYKTAEAAYNESVAAAGQDELQSAWSSIQTAQKSLDDLKAKPTATDLASAEAQVASASSQLEDLLNGTSEAELRSAKISVEKAQIDLDDAKQNLIEATLNAPIDGTILTINVTEGTRVTSDGLTAMTMSDLSQLQLTVNVTEVDIPKISTGQAVKITLDALPDRTLNGTVSRIEPYSSATDGVVYYPVTIILTDKDLSGILPGMTAVAEFVSDELEAAWMVPTSAINEKDGKTMVMILRDNRPAPVEVTKVGVQGEWTIVQSPELKEGDQALGSVTSFINENNDMRGGMMMGGGPPSR